MELESTGYQAYSIYAVVSVSVWEQLVYKLCLTFLEALDSERHSFECSNLVFCISQCQMSEESFVIFVNVIIYDSFHLHYASVDALAEGINYLFHDRLIEDIFLACHHVCNVYACQHFSGLEYYAAFIGCSAETEASFETISFLSKKIDELSLKNVITIEGTDHSIAETVIKSTKSQDQKILTLDSMQSTTDKDAGYLEIMKKNLEVLKEALA